MYLELRRLLDLCDPLGYRVVIYPSYKQGGGIWFVVYVYEGEEEMVRATSENLSFACSAAIGQLEDLK